jgi:hypothetical protein
MIQKVMRLTYVPSSRLGSIGLAVSAILQHSLHFLESTPKTPTALSSFSAIASFADYDL